MILDVYHDIIKEITLCDNYFYTNRKYVRVLNDQLHDVINEEVYSKMSTSQGKKDKEAMSIDVNYLKKIVNKLSQLYTFDVERTASTNQELFDYYAKTLRPNTKLQRGTELYNASKSTLMEIYADKKNNLNWRAIANDRYYLYTTDLVDDTTPEYVVKIIETKEYKCEKSNKTIIADLLFIYSDTEFLAIDTAGKIYDEYMPMNGEEPLGWVNVLGFLPFVHVNQDNDNLNPEEDIDTLNTLLQVNSILTDATVANYYQAFPIITATNVDEENANFSRNPNDILILNPPQGSDATPSINVIPSSLDTSKSTALAKQILEMVMDSKGLKVNSQNAKSNISGFQEMINNSDTTEVRKIQIQDWEPAEEELWEKTAMYHNWLVKNKAALLPRKMPKQLFSEDFYVEVEFDNVDTNVEQQQNLNEATSGSTTED